MTQELGKLQDWPCPPQLGTDPECQHGWQSQGWDRADQEPQTQRGDEAESLQGAWCAAAEGLKTKQDPCSSQGRRQDHV